MKSLVAIIVGVMVGIFIIGLLETLGHMIYPPAEGLDIKNPEMIRSIMNEIPFGAKFTVILAWVIGNFVGTSLTLRIGSGKAVPGWITAGLLWGAGVSTLFVVPHPLWMIVGGVLLPPFSAYAAQKLFSR